MPTAISARSCPKASIRSSISRAICSCASSGRAAVLLIASGRTFAVIQSTITHRRLERTSASSKVLANRGKGHELTIRVCKPPLYLGHLIVCEVAVMDVPLFRLLLSNLIDPNAKGHALFACFAALYDCMRRPLNESGSQSTNFPALIRASASAREVAREARSVVERTGSSSIVVTGTIAVRRVLGSVLVVMPGL